MESNRYRASCVDSRPWPRRRSRVRSSSSTTAPRAAPSCSSSTATTSPTAPSSRCRRSWRRATACRRTPCSGFGNMLFKLLADYGPRGVAVAWDTRPVHRAAVAEAVDVVYKQGRKPMPDLLREQFPLLQADRRGLRLSQPRVRGVGGRRRDRHDRHPCRRGGREDVRGLDRPQTPSSSAPRT